MEEHICRMMAEEDILWKGKLRNVHQETLCPLHLNKSSFQELYSDWLLREDRWLEDVKNYQPVDGETTQSNYCLRQAPTLDSILEDNAQIQWAPSCTQLESYDQVKRCGRIRWSPPFLTAGKGLNLQRVATTTSVIIETPLKRLAQDTL